MNVMFQYYDLAADVLAENAHLTYKFLSTVSILDDQHVYCLTDTPSGTLFGFKTVSILCRNKTYFTV